MCQCIKRINVLLIEHNAALETNLLATPARALISLYKVRPRGPKPPLLEATCCPFCGKPYPKRKRDLAAKRAK